MNKREFFKWLSQQGCEIKPKEGVNNTAPPLEINKAHPERYCYFTLSPIQIRFLQKQLKSLLRI
jgi:hypothetical protein